jgi:hypothetical protein
MLPLEFPYRLSGKFIRVMTVFFVVLLCVTSALTYMFVIGAADASIFQGRTGGKLLIVLPVETAFVFLFPYLWWRNRRMMLHITDAELTVDHLFGTKRLPVAEMQGLFISGEGDNRSLRVAAAMGRRPDIHIMLGMLPSVEAFEQVLRTLHGLQPDHKATAAGSRKS